MPDAATVAGFLLVAGPVVGLIPVAHPSLLPVWSASREDHLAIVGAHRTAWAWLNAGFALATIATAAGLAILPQALDVAGADRAWLTAAALGYLVGGIAWCAVLAIRARTTPALADHVAAGRPTEPGESLLGAAVGGLFAAFVLATTASLAALGVGLLVSGAVAWPVAAIAIACGAGLAAVQVATGDVIPATLYLPTIVLGIALLAGWS